MGLLDWLERLFTDKEDYTVFEFSDDAIPGPRYQSSHSACWTTVRTVDDVLFACQQRIAYRKQRMEYWDKERKDAEETLRTQGIVVTRSFDQFNTLSYSNSALPGANVKVVVDEEMQRKLSEAETKYEEHKGQHELYVLWEAFLGSMPEDYTLPLTMTDYKFFYKD